MNNSNNISTTIDTYGFLHSKHSTEFIEEEQRIKKNNIIRDNARFEKWRLLLNDLPKKIEKKDPKLKQRIRKGIPDGLRGKVWPMLADIQNLKKNSSITYEELLKIDNVPYLDAIITDVRRTFSTHELFIQRDGIGQKSLENVLKALSLTYKDMGYCQGLNFIAAILVIYCKDEDAYWIMCSLMKRYNLLDNYSDLENVKKPLYALDELLKVKIPKLGSHLIEKHKIEGLYYGTGWFMTLFTDSLPFGLVIRLMDIFLFEKIKILYRIALAIFKYKEKELLEYKGMDKILISLRNFNDKIWADDDKFIKTAFDIRLRTKEIVQTLKTYKPVQSHK